MLKVGKFPLGWGRWIDRNDMPGVVEELNRFLAMNPPESEEIQTNPEAPLHEIERRHCARDRSRHP